MALAYEDLQLAPNGELSVVTEAASLDAPELALPDSRYAGGEDETSNISSDEPTFLSEVDRHMEEQRLLQLMLKGVGHIQVSLAHATALTAPWLVEESFTRELSNWKDAYELIRSTTYHLMQITSDRTRSAISNAQQIIALTAA
jgi:hypothetical protein